jgi:hypothetical protein
MNNMQRFLVTMHTGCISRVCDSDSFGVLMLSVVLFSVNLFVLLEILRAFEGLPADITHVRFEGCMD